ATDGLHRGAKASENGEAQCVDPAGVAQPAINDGTNAAFFLHADGDQFAEVADTVAVARPDRYVAVGQGGAGFHFVGVAAEAVRRHLPAYGVGPTRQAL